jgi:Chaperone of endosialidase/Bacterial Ig domain
MPSRLVLRRCAMYAATAIWACALATPAVADDIRVSQSPNRSASILLAGATVFGDVFIYFETATPDNAIRDVEFFIDGTQVGKDNQAPYDLTGGPAAAANAYDTLILLTDGPHSMEVVLTLKNGTAQSVTAEFAVDNAFAPITPSTALKVVTATADIDAQMLTLGGFNFDRGSAPRVSLDLQPILVTAQTSTWLTAQLPPGLVAGDHTVNVSTDQRLLPGVNDDDHAEILLTVGAVGPAGPVGPEGPPGPPGPTPNGLATLGANTFTGTQTIDGGNLDLDPSSATSGNVTKSGLPFLHNLGFKNTFLGVNAGLVTTSAGGNTAVGADALRNASTGSSNTAIGYDALLSNTSGSSNTAAGGSAMFFNTTGMQNTATGYLAMRDNRTGSGNTSVGQSALQRGDGTSNTAIGSHTMAGGMGFFTGSENTAIGGQALRELASGANNTAAGFGALLFNSDGSNNTANGYRALFSNTVGANNVAAGAFAGVSLVTGSNNIYLGANVLGTPGESNTMYLGAQGIQAKAFIAGVRGITTVNPDAIAVVIDSAGQLGTISSSRRFKEDIKDMAGVSEGLFRLRPVTFRYKQAYGDGSKPLQYGLVAEEVAEVYPELVVHTATGQVETVQYDKLNTMLLNEVQKQHRRLAAQAEQIRALASDNQALLERFAALAVRLQLIEREQASTR